MTERHNRYVLPFAVTVLGVSHVVTQITVIREFINVVAGNETVLGILVSLWLLLTGIGAWLGRFIRSSPVQLSFFRLSLLIVAFLPIAHIMSIRFLRDCLFMRGELPGIGSLTVWAACLLVPYCFVTGGLLTLACSVLLPSDETGKSIGRVYFFDNIGDILGGVLFTFVLVHCFNNLTILYVPALLCLAGFILIKGNTRNGEWTHHIIGILSMACLVGMMVCRIDTISIKWLYPEQTIIDHVESPYGRVVVTKQHEQVSFFENGGHLFSTPNVFANEELVHYALSQLHDVHSVLLISGGVSGIIHEIQKYHIVRIDYVELDPAILAVAGRHMDDRFPPSVHVYTQDGRTFITHTSEKYDAVILDLPDPTSLQLNRFYTRELFGDITAVLKPGGVVCFAVQGAENYISEELARFLSTLRNTLRDVFTHVLIIPGDRNVFISSNSPLSDDIASLIAAQNIETVYVNEHYLAGRVTPERLAFLEKSLIEEAPLNYDFTPTAFFYDIRVWLSMFRENFALPLIAMVLFFSVYFIRVGMISKTLFSTGFTASSMEITLLLCYQIAHGSVYTGIGLLVAAFMTGLAAGSYAANRLSHVRMISMVKIECAIGVYLLLFALLLIAGKAVFTRGVFTILAVVIGALTGAEFPIAGRLTFSSVRETAGTLYAADLLGGSLGAFATSLFLIPWFGLYWTCFFLVGFKILIITGLVVRIRS